MLLSSYYHTSGGFRKNKNYSCIDQKNLNSGNYSFTWDGKNQNNIEVSSGTYICKLVSGNYSDQIKLLLIK